MRERESRKDTKVDESQMLKMEMEMKMEMHRNAAEKERERERDLRERIALREFMF